MSTTGGNGTRKNAAAAAIVEALVFFLLLAAVLAPLGAAVWYTCSAAAPMIVCNEHLCSLSFPKQ